MSQLEEQMALQIKAARLPKPQREVAGLVDGRKFRVDFYWPWHSIERMVDADELRGVVLEVDGGTWSGGRHTRGKGFEADCEKTNLLALQGYLVLRVTRTHVEDGRALAWVREALGR